jgi:hypothetical protein
MLWGPTAFEVPHRPSREIRDQTGMTLKQISLFANIIFDLTRDVHLTGLRRTRAEEDRRNETITRGNSYRVDALPTYLSQTCTSWNTPACLAHGHDTCPPELL